MKQELLWYFTATAVFNYRKALKDVRLRQQAWSDTVTDSIDGHQTSLLGVDVLL